MPTTIAAGSSLPITIKFTPNASGKALGKAGFVSNSPNTPTVAQLVGTGVVPGSHSVDLSWSTGSGSAVGYNVYRGTVSGGPYAKINNVLDAATNYTDASVAAGKTYYYATTQVHLLGYLEEIHQAILAARDVSTKIPIVAQVTIDSRYASMPSFIFRSAK